MDLKTATPLQIDTELARIYVIETELRKTRQGLRRGQLNAMARFERNDFAGTQYHPTFEARNEAFVTSMISYDERIAAKDAEIGECWAEAKPFQDEYRSRPWRRYFEVMNTNGHIHSSTHCGTCFNTTRFAWLVEYADQSAEDTIYKHGTSCCTVCFPDAPVVEKDNAIIGADGKCSNKGWISIGREDRYSPYAKCSHCGEIASITKAGNLRKHKAGPDA